MQVHSVDHRSPGEWSLWEKQCRTPSEQSHPTGEEVPGNRLCTLQHSAQAVLILPDQQASTEI